MSDNSERERYFDFSEEDDVVQDFNAPSHYEEWKKVLAKEAQTALSRRNPIIGLKQLLAFHMTTQAFQLNAIKSLLTSIRVFLIINIVLIFAAIYFLFSK